MITDTDHRTFGLEFSVNDLVFGQPKVIVGPSPRVRMVGACPDNIGLGIANHSLMGGRLLLAMDVLYKQWDNADFFDVFFTNLFVFKINEIFANTEGVAEWVTIGGKR